jgi:hypothetical protein
LDIYDAAGDAVIAAAEQMESDPEILSQAIIGTIGEMDGALSPDQKGLMRQVLRDLLAPFRQVDAEESMRLMESQGLGNLNLAYFKGEDLGKDGVWDVWQIEGPNMLWYFRGDPHVHCWVHIRDGKA